MRRNGNLTKLWLSTLVKGGGEGGEGGGGGREGGNRERNC